MSHAGDQNQSRLLVVSALLVGTILGAAVAFYLSAARGLAFLPSFLAASAVVSAVIYGVARLFVELGAAPAAMIFPHGDGTASPPPYLSRAQALVAGRHYEEARRLYESALDADACDIHALLALSELHYGPLRDPEAGHQRLLQAIASGRLEAGAEALQMRRLAEAMMMGAKPVRAAPHLARLAERFPGSAHGAWAAEELRALKARSLADTDD